MDTEQSNAFWEARRSTLALASVSTTAKLRKRINEAKSCLKREYAARFRKPRFAPAERRLYSDDGQLFLQWRNASTTVGTVSLYERLPA